MRHVLTLQALHAPSRLRLREARALGAMMCAEALKRSKIYVKKARPGTKYLNHLNRTGLSYTDRHLSRYDIRTPVRCYEGWRRVVNLTTFGDRNARH